MIGEKFKKKIENLKKSLGGIFYRMIEYTYDDINSWLVEKINKNEDIETILQNLSIDHREIESELLNIKLKQEVTIPP
jgi:hypothetical protein